MTYDLIFFPDYRAANPYQRLLYDRLGRLHPSSGTIDDALRQLDRAAWNQRVVFHLHWEDTLHRHVGDPAAAGYALRSFLEKLEDFVVRGGTFVWTVHNRGSHVAAHPDLERMLQSRLSSLADRVHVHSVTAAGHVRHELGTAPEKLIVLPHGNYLPIHDPRSVEPAVERARRGWADERVLLLFGRLDAYKGAAELLEAFGRDSSGGRLVLAGKQPDPLQPLIDRLPAPVRSRITVLDGFVPEQDVAGLFSAVDAVVLPYREILTSGSLMLALSLAKPVITPALEAIEEVVRDGREALLYAPDQPDGLERTLRRFAELDGPALVRMGEHAGTTAALYDWAWIGRQMAGAVVEATEHGRAVRRSLQPMAPSAGPG